MVNGKNKSVKILISPIKGPSRYYNGYTTLNYFINSKSDCMFQQCIPSAQS